MSRSESGAKPAERTTADTEHIWQYVPIYREDELLGFCMECETCRERMYPEDLIKRLEEWEK